MTSPKKKVVIIEDEKILLELLSKKFRNEGFEVFTAEDGQAGLKLIESSHPDVVLLDIIMPKMDGYEVLSALQEKHGSINLPPIIIISNSGQPVEIDRAKELGARDFIIKAQFTPEEVLQKVRQQIGTAISSAGNVASSQPAQALPKNAAAKKSIEARVLVVEDDQFLGDLLKTKLEKENFGVSTAMDGPTGVEKILKERPDIVLLDIILPGVDGFEVLKRVRTDASESISRIPIVLLSNLGQETDIEKGRALGANDYLIKSNFTIDEIITKIRAVISRL